MRWCFAALLLGCASCRVAFDRLAESAAEDAALDGDAAGLSPSVQVVSLVMNMTVKTATINPVDPTRTVVLCDFRTAGSYAARQPMCELVDATTVRVTFGVADASATVQLQVVQLPLGVTVERGTHDMANGLPTEQFTIPAVDRAQSFVLYSR